MASVSKNVKDHHVLIILFLVFVIVVLLLAMAFPDVVPLGKWMFGSGRTMRALNLL